MLLAVLVVLSTVTLGVVSAFTAAFTLAATTAFIVPGTGTHNIGTVTGYKENAVSRFIDPSGACYPFTCAPVGVDYPASFWPIPLPGWCPNLTCDTWNVSVGKGVDNLTGQVNEFYGNPDNVNQSIVVFGYSQGGAVVSHYMYSIPDERKAQITVVTIGNIENPQGLWSRLSFLPTIPLFNITFGPTLPTDIGVRSYNYSFEYDPVGDAPLYWGNPVTMLNALAAFEYVHGNYLVPNSNSPDDALPYGYTDATLASTINDELAHCQEAAGSNCRNYQDATFILIPQQGTLPIYQPFVDLGKATGLTPVVQPLVDLASPVTKVVIDLGYDRTSNPGIPQTLSILPFNPFQNPLTVGADLVNAGIEGVQDFVSDLGGLAPAPTLAPTGPSPFSTLAEGQPILPLTRNSRESSPVITSLGTAPKLDVGDLLGNKTTMSTVTKPAPFKRLALAPDRPKWRPGNLFRPGETKLQKLQSETTSTTAGSGTTPPPCDPSKGENPPAGTPQSQDAVA